MANKIKPKFNFTWFYIAAGAILLSMLLFDGGNKEQIREVKYSELRDYVERGYVEEITVHDNGEVEAYLKKDSASNVFKGAEIRENARPLVITTIGSADNFDEFIFEMKKPDENGNTRFDGTLTYKRESGFFSNFVTRHLEKGFQGVGNYFMSDMFVQNASFLKVDNVTLGYSFDNLFKRGINGRIYATVQNVLTITKYKGLDPEVGSGIDNNFYPRPLVTMLGLSLNF